MWPFKKSLDKKKTEQTATDVGRALQSATFLAPIVVGRLNQSWRLQYLVFFFLIMGLVMEGAVASPVDPNVSRGYLQGLTGGIHYCSAGHCFNLGRRDMPQVDRASFRSLSERYAADSMNVYYEGRLIKDADPVTLRVLGPHHAADQKSLFVQEFRVRDADPATARYLRHYVVDQQKVWYVEFESGRSDYVMREITGADPSRFHQPDPRELTLATDGRQIYLRGKTLPLQLGKDFRLLETTNLLSFVSDEQLHLLAFGLVWPDQNHVRDSGSPNRRTWISLPGPPAVEGQGAYRLINGRWLIAEQGRSWRLIKEGVKQLTDFDSSSRYCVADGVLWYSSPRWEMPPFEVGQVSSDLRFLSREYLINQGQVIYHGRPVLGADPASFQIAQKGIFRFSVDAMDTQWLYGQGVRVDVNDESGRERNRMPRR